LVIKVTFTALEKSRLPSLERARTKGKKECRRAKPGANEKKALDEEKVQREKDRENEGRERKISKEKTVNQSISAKKMFPIK